MGLVVFAFISIFILVTSAGLLLFYREAMLRRLSQVVSPRQEHVSVLSRVAAVGSGAAIGDLVEPFQKVLPRSSEETSVTQQRLIRAGFRQDSAVNIFYGAKVLCPIILAGLATVTGVYEIGPIFIYAVALGLGFLVPDFWLGNRISNRQNAIKMALPDVLDLMVICIEAGLSLDQATQRTAEELAISHPALSDEMNLVILEQHAGRPRLDCWTHMADRVDIESVRSFVAMLIQADKFGTSIAKALRVHSETLRTQRKQMIEEQAAKTTVKLVFPLVLFIFPSLFVVTLGPSMIVMMDAFSKYLS